MELPDVGKQCGLPECAQLDFLPTTCAQCAHSYCDAHRRPHDGHECINGRMPWQRDAAATLAKARARCCIVMVVVHVDGDDVCRRNELVWGCDDLADLVRSLRVLPMRFEASSKDGTNFLSVHPVEKPPAVFLLRPDAQVIQRLDHAVTLDLLQAALTAAVASVPAAAAAVAKASSGTKEPGVSSSTAAPAAQQQKEQQKQKQPVVKGSRRDPRLLVPVGDEQRARRAEEKKLAEQLASVRASRSAAAPARSAAAVAPTSSQHVQPAAHDAPGMILSAPKRPNVSTDVSSILVASEHPGDADDLDSGDARTREAVRSRPSPQSVQLSFRLTDGSGLRHAFPAATSLASVRAWLDAHRTDGSAPYYLQMAYPMRRVFIRAELDDSLADLGLVPSATIILSLSDASHPPLDQRGGHAQSAVVPASPSHGDGAPGRVSAFVTSVCAGLSFLNPLGYLPVPTEDQPADAAAGSADETVATAPAVRPSERPARRRPD